VGAVGLLAVRHMSKKVQESRRINEIDAPCVFAYLGEEESEL